jgi:hypothetical protein
MSFDAFPQAESVRAPGDGNPETVGDAFDEDAALQDAMLSSRSCIWEPWGRSIIPFPAVEREAGLASSTVDEDDTDEPLSDQAWLDLLDEVPGLPEDFCKVCAGGKWDCHSADICQSIIGR